MLPYMFEYLWNQTKYLCFNTLEKRALRGQPLEMFRINNTGTDPKKYTYFAKTDTNIRELVTITVDLDSYKRGLPVEIALGVVLHHCQTDRVPLPSLFARSGRGSYLIWLLKDDDGRPPLNTCGNHARYRAIVENLLFRFEDLEADAHSLIPSQFYKSPGTINTKTGRRVYYAAFGGGPLAEIPLYTLDQIKDALGIHLTLLPSIDGDRLLGNREFKLHRSQPGHGGERHRACISEIEQINAARGGLKEGCRAMALFFYFQAYLSYLKTVYRAGLTGLEAIADADRQARSKAWRSTFSLNSTFDPPLRECEVKKACKSGFRFPKGTRRGYPRRSMIAAFLGVSCAESERLDLTHILPAPIIEEQRRVKAHEKALRKARRDAVDEELMAGKTSPTKIARRVSERLGVECSRQLVYARKKAMEKKGELPTRQPIPSLFSRTATITQEVAS